MKGIILILSLVFFSVKSHAQLNVELLHQLVQHSKDEYQRQSTARNRQAETSTNEEINRSKMEVLKQKYRNLQRRFQLIGLAIDASQIGLQAAPLISDITTNQQKIVQLAGDDPLLIGMAYQAEVDIADRVYMLSRYLYALTISLGDLNQMKTSDRKLLFEHVLTEFRVIAGASRGLAVSLLQAKRKKMLASINPFQGVINRDRQLINDILSKLKQIEQ